MNKKQLTDMMRAWYYVKRVWPNTVWRSENDLAVNCTRLVEALQIAYAAGLRAGRKEL